VKVGSASVVRFYFLINVPMSRCREPSRRPFRHLRAPFSPGDFGDNNLDMDAFECGK
jgi:hypothetical protein